MFLVDWIPSSVFVFLGIAGVAILVLSPIIGRIPFISQYKLPLTAAGAVMIIFSAWMHGMASTKGHWEQKLVATQAELQAAKAEATAAKENIRVEERVVTKIQYIKEKTNENVRAIQQIAPQLNADCKLSNDAVVLIDNATRPLEMAGSTSQAPGTTQAAEASDVLKTVVENYGICNEHIEVIKGWQSWYWTQKKIFESTIK